MIKNGNTLDLSFGQNDGKARTTKALSVTLSGNNNVMSLIKGIGTFDLEAVAKESDVAEFLNAVKRAKINFVQLSSPSIANGNISKIELEIERRTPDGLQNEKVNLNEFNTMDAFQTGKITIPLANISIGSNDCVYLNVSTLSDSNSVVSLSTTLGHTHDY